MYCLTGRQHKNIFPLQYAYGWKIVRYINRHLGAIPFMVLLYKVLQFADVSSIQISIDKITGIKKPAKSIGISAKAGLIQKGAFMLSLVSLALFLKRQQAELQIGAESLFTTNIAIVTACILRYSYLCGQSIT